MTRRFGDHAITPELIGPVSDAELLIGCRAGDASSWDTLVRRYERLVYSVALRSGLSRTDAADVSQATFIALLKSIDQLREDERLASWLITVARRNSWRLIRRATPESSVAELPEHAAAESVSWEDVAELHEAVHRLGSPCEELLTALYFDPEEPSYQEIAQRLDRSIGGIGPLRGRCLSKIRSLIEEAAQ